MVVGQRDVLERGALVHTSALELALQWPLSANEGFGPAWGVQHAGTLLSLVV